MLDTLTVAAYLRGLTTSAAADTTVKAKLLELAKPPTSSKQDRRRDTYRSGRPQHRGQRLLVAELSVRRFGGHLARSRIHLGDLVFCEGHLGYAYRAPGLCIQAQKKRM
jgi:hypothetical protein